MGGAPRGHVGWWLVGGTWRYGRTMTDGQVGAPTYTSLESLESLERGPLERGRLAAGYEITGGGQRCGEVVSDRGCRRGAFPRYRHGRYCR